MDLLPSTHYHSKIVKQFNREHSEAIDLSEATLLACARRETGLEQFGDETFQPAMRTLLDAIKAEAHLNPFGRFITQSRTLRALTNRLRANVNFEANPEIRERKIVAPLIIVGLHRSGTTRLQRMLATDTRLQYLKTWEGMNPAPYPGQPDFGRMARYEEVKKSLAAFQQIYPGARTAHPMDADWPEEEMLLLNQSFCGFSPLGLYHVPSYYQWFLNNDKQDGYRYMSDLLKLISWSHGADGDRRWILKNPQHLLDLPTLMKTFPDAKLVFAHRDPIKTVGSVMSLMWFYAVQHTDLPCRARIRDVWMDFCEQMARRSIQARETIPAEQQIDVHFEDMNRDWRGEMGRIYDFADMEFTPKAGKTMSDWLDESEREGLHGGHRYALEDFGTSAEEVDARMMFYRERYSIAYEGGKR